MLLHGEERMSPQPTIFYQYEENGIMNLDNRRLKEIREFKTAYQTLMDKSSAFHEIEEYNCKIKELEKEEKEILERCDVII